MRVCVTVGFHARSEILNSPAIGVRTMDIVALIPALFDGRTIHIGITVQIGKFRKFFAVL